MSGGGGNKRTSEFKSKVKAKPKTKTKTFGIRLTDEERAELERRAGELALGAYIKAVLFAGGDKRRYRGSRKPVKDHIKLAEVLACLGQSRLSETLERLSQAVETGTLYIDDDVPQAIQKACDDICMMRVMLMTALGFRMSSCDQEKKESTSQAFTRASHKIEE